MALKLKLLITELSLTMLMENVSSFSLTTELNHFITNTQGSVVAPVSTNTSHIATVHS